jgi:histidyl-tRNA synthetase
MLKQADRSGASFVAILGEDGTILKDMESGEQEELEPAAVVARVLRGRHIG